MLRLKNIKKNYIVAGASIEVLKGLNISFRKNEFVSILGPSGCGKTTTLNIIGGLDKYTDGDLFIAGKSTKEFSDRDWDFYRNQRIGFIFQSYNLIPHQTVLGNVELALTISGVSKEERTKRAKEALDKVGLQGEYNKRPNQLSGGQCQRVAIARALVNEPEILLADEPTGALDTKTSIQIMDLIKEIAQERLVIMVTHNPELAEKYSNRIIRLIDGEVVEDTNPYSEEEEIKETDALSNEEKNKKSKAKMSWWTAFKLSLRNLLTKRNRTILTCIASSIGIIGVSSVLSVSSGVKNYIASMQDDMLSGNPITISETSYDYESIMNSMSTGKKAELIAEKGYVNVDSLVEYLMKTYGNTESVVINNDITKLYVEYVKAMPKEYYAAIMERYGIDMSNSIYTDFTYVNPTTNQKETTNYSLAAVLNIYESILEKVVSNQYSSLIASMSSVMSQAPNNEEYILSQYNLVSGSIAKEKNQIMVVLDSQSALTDVVLAQLGYYTQDEFINIAYRADNNTEKYDETLDKMKFSYDEILGKKFTWYNNDMIFSRNRSLLEASLKPYKYAANSEGFDKSKGLELEVVGILTPKDNISYGCLKSGFYYTEALTQYVLAQNLESEIVRYLQANNKSSFGGTVSNGTVIDGQVVPYQYSYYFEGTQYTQEKVCGSENKLSSLMAMISGASSGPDMQMYDLSIRDLGGEDKPNYVAIYPVNFEMKDQVRNYLDEWNTDNDIILNGRVITKDERADIKYTDSLSLIIAMINSMIDIITTALVAFTALSLVVSCVMIAIVTYISVVERIKEIGVIRSLGGRKRDVSNLFNAETVMLGFAAGLFGVLMTYLLSLIVNLSVGKMIGFDLCQLPITTACIMLLLSVFLTVLSGLIPARAAAHQDPVNALRSE